MNKHLSARFLGNVQGVGFRYAATILGQEMGLKGFVKNLDDGAVLVEAEGQEILLQEFLDHLKKKFSKNIRSIDSNFSEDKNQYESFNIN